MKLQGRKTTAGAMAQPAGRTGMGRLWRMTRAGCAALAVGALAAFSAGRLPAPDETPPPTAAELDAKFNNNLQIEAGTEPELTYTALQGITPALPEDEAKTGWQQLLANDFTAARAALEKVLIAQPGQRSATAGLILLNELEGHPEDSADLYLARIRAAAGTPDALSAMNDMLAAENLPIDAGDRLGKLQLELINDPQTDKGVRAILASSLLAYPRGKNFLTAASADPLLPKSGLISAYQLVVGPFGLYYNDLGGGQQALALLQRPFPPENGFGTLEFTDPVPTPAPVLPPRAAAWPRVTLKNPETHYGRLDVESRLPNYGHTAIFYTVTNLDCGQDLDAIFMLNDMSEAVVFLNGLPIWTPDAARGRAPSLYLTGGRLLLKARLHAGHNPIVIKHTADHSDFSIRVLGTDFAPIPGVLVKPLSDEEIAALKVTNLRGQIVSQPVLAYDLAYRIGSVSGQQSRRRLGDLIAAAARTNVVALPGFCRDLLWQDYLSALTLAASFRATYPQSAVARLFEADMQRAVVAGHLASDGRYGVPARATLDALAKEFPKLYAVRYAELEIAQERNDADRVLMLARKQAHDFPEVALSRVRLAQQYLKREWKPEAEAEIGAFLDLYSAGDGYINHAPQEAHRLARDFYAEKGRQSTYLKLRAEGQKAGQDSALERALHLLTLGQPGEGLKLLKDDLARWPVYARDIEWEIAMYQHRLGNWDAFSTGLEARLTRNPYDAGAAASLIDVAVRRGMTEEALTAIDRYNARFGPNENLSRMALDLRKQDPLAWFKPYDLPADAVSPKDYTVAKYQSADVAHLVSLRVLKYSADTSAWEYQKEITAPLITNAVDQVSQQRLGTIKNVLHAGSVNPDGKSYIPEYIRGDTAEMYNVEVGTAVTTDHLTFHGGDDSHPAVRVQEQFGTIEDPLGIDRLVVILPKALDAKVKIWMNLPDAIKHTRTEDGDEVIHQFENISHEPLKREARMPQEDLIPRLEMFTDDEMLSHEAALSLRVEPDYPTALVIETAQAIRKTLAADASREQQFDAVVNWVKTELRPGQGTVSLDDMIAMKVAGDRPTRMQLAQALCQAINLPVREVVQVSSGINPYRNIPALKRRQEYNPSQLANLRGLGVLALEDSAGGIQFRRVFGQQAQFYPSLPAMPTALDSDSPLFSYIALAAPLGAELRRYDGVRPTADSFRLQLDVQVQADNTANLRGRAYLFGGYAGQIREQRTDARQRQMLENSIAQWFWPQLESRTISYLDGSNPDNPMELGLIGKISRLGQVDPAKPAEGISIPALLVQGRNSQSAILGLIGQTERLYDYVLEDHIDSTQSPFYPAVLAFEAPAGWAWSEVPEDLVLQSEFGWYYCDYQVVGGRVEIHRGFMVPKQRLNPEQWKRFNAFLGAIRNYENLGKLVCTPLPGGSVYHTDYLSPGALRTDLSW